MELRIKIEDYLTEDDMREICEEEFKKAVRTYFRHEQDVTRILSNAGYEIVHREVDKYVAGEQSFTEVIKDNVDRVISNGLNTWDVFRAADAFGNQSSVGYKILQEAVKNSKEQIVRNVEKVVEDYPYDEIREAIKDALYEVLEDKLTGGKDEK